ncbi:hypothetical protein ElyMa_004439500 [Elysia marginata]|uniref:Uncharacterized protein n=1 Tax=Elysia marginata TaxID=1093978 RepID=A0AAV4HCJ2_9GAST|nr:hypothetical protein ElyMa_004439500 [Elysia marginata]
MLVVIKSAGENKYFNNIINQKEKEEGVYDEEGHDDDDADKDEDGNGFFLSCGNDKRAHNHDHVNVDATIMAMVMITMKMKTAMMMTVGTILIKKVLLSWTYPADHHESDDPGHSQVTLATMVTKIVFSSLLRGGVTSESSSGKREY